MPKQKQILPLSQQYKQNERLIEAVENLYFSVDCLKKYIPNTCPEILMGIIAALNNINNTLNKHNKIINQYLK